MSRFNKRRQSAGPAFEDARDPFISDIGIITDINYPPPSVLLRFRIIYRLLRRGVCVEEKKSVQFVPSCCWQFNLFPESVLDATPFCCLELISLINYGRGFQLLKWITRFWRMVFILAKKGKQTQDDWILAEKLV
jgi:hypothetical protein